MAFGVGFSCAKTPGPIWSQVFVERRENIDWKRNAAFASFGFGHLGSCSTRYMCQYSHVYFSPAEKFAAKSLREKAADFKGPGRVGGASLFRSMRPPPWRTSPPLHDEGGRMSWYGSLTEKSL